MKEKQGTITYTAYLDDVNGWGLPDEECIFDHSNPISGGTIWRGGFENTEPELALRVYERRDNLGRLFYSFTIGIYEDWGRKWLPIEGFNLVEEQIRDIFKSSLKKQKENV